MDPFQTLLSIATCTRPPLSHSLSFFAVPATCLFWSGAAFLCFAFFSTHSRGSRSQVIIYGFLTRRCLSKSSRCNRLCDRRCCISRRDDTHTSRRTILPPHVAAMHARQLHTITQSRPTYISPALLTARCPALHPCYLAAEEEASSPHQTPTY